MSGQKRSVSLHGHRTSVALEPEFWTIIDHYIKAHDLSLAGFIKDRDDERILQKHPSGLASYLRVWAVRHVQSLNNEAHMT